ncbi:unnamed protein product [Ectocarpus fasciculatus]
MASPRTSDRESCETWVHRLHRGGKRVQPILSRAKCCRTLQQPQISWSASLSTARGFAHINILSGQAQFCSNLTFHGNLRTCRRYILRGLSRRAPSISTAVVVFNA